MDEVAMTDVGCQGLLEICRATYSPLCLSIGVDPSGSGPNTRRSLPGYYARGPLIAHRLHMRRRAQETVLEYLLCVN